MVLPVARETKSVARKRQGNTAKIPYDRKGVILGIMTLHELNASYADALASVGSFFAQRKRISRNYEEDFSRVVKGLELLKQAVQSRMTDLFDPFDNPPEKYDLILIDTRINNMITNMQRLHAS